MYDTCNRAIKQREEYSKFLQSCHFDSFITLTFREEFTERAAMRAINRCLEKVPYEIAFTCIEKGSRYGRVHAHGLARGIEHDGDLFKDGDQVLRRAINRHWRKQYGIAKVEALWEDAQSATRYVCKYVLKDLLSKDDWYEFHVKTSQKR